MNTATALTAETIAIITEAVGIELLKRGFTATITATEKKTRHNELYLDVTSEGFQTVPVIMQSIFIDGTLYVREESDTRLRVGGRIGVRYTHFTGGSNGTELFSIDGIVRKDREDFYEVTIR